MSARLAARFARRELRGGISGFYIFLICLTLGVAAIAAVGTVRSAITAGLAREGASMLGGDAQIEFTYRFARQDELDWMDATAARRSEVVDFRSMAVVGSGTSADRALTQVRAVDSLYPLIGAVELSPDMPLDTAFAGSGGLPGAVMEQLLADRLALAPGDSFHLGEQEFILSAILTRYPDNTAGGFGLGPRTILRRTDLEDSGLITEGTLFSTLYRISLPPGTNIETVKDAAEARFGQSGMRWRDARQGAGGAARFVDRLGAFLVLMGLAGLAVGGVGVSAAVRAYLASKTSTIATLRTLGATRNTVFLTYLFQIGALTIVGVALGLVLGAGLPLLLAPLITAQLPIPAEFALYPAPLAEAALYGLLTALIFTLWPLARTEEVRAASLFRDAFAAGNLLPRPRYVVATALLLAILLGAAVWFSGTAFLTLWTAGGIAIALLALVLTAALARLIARKSARISRGRPALRLALGAISARGGETTSTVLSLGLGLAVLAAVGQIDGNIRRAISEDLPDIAPSYFFIDIQTDQMEGFRTRLDDDPAVSRVDAAPMLRGIITQVNGIPAAEFGRHWVLANDRGITYAATPPDGTIITAGDWWAEDYTGPPLISFAREEAEEIGLKLGDTLVVNVLGRDIEATIANFREVNFQSVGIGFVILMNPAAVAGAPHSWISTVYAEEEAEAAILRDLANAYPNITAIRIRDAVNEIARIVGGIATATRYGAGVTLLTGFFVLIGAAATGERARTYEAAVLKTLGASRAQILGSFALRAALLGLVAGLVALAAGIAGGWAVTVFMMESDFVPIWNSALAIIIGGVGATLTAGLVFALRPLAARPAQVLRAQE